MQGGRSDVGKMSKKELCIIRHHHPSLAISSDRQESNGTDILVGRGWPAALQRRPLAW